MKYGLTQTTVEKICAVFARFPAVEKAVLYGSRAKGNFKLGSDIDLTLYGEALSYDLCSAIALELDDLLLPYTIDLSVFDMLKTASLLEHIQRVGVVFYEREGEDSESSRGGAENAEEKSMNSSPPHRASAPPREKTQWLVKRLGDCCDVINGGTPKTGIADYWDGEHAWVTPAEMGKRSSPYIEETSRTLTYAGMANSSARTLPPNSVILSSRAPIGHLVINTVPMAFNQGCKGLVPKKELHHKFLYYFLYASVDLLNSLGTGATFKELSGGKLKDVEIPVPPLPEQKRIVSILDEAFEGIAKAKATAEANLLNARALFQSHLQSVFSQKGEGWVETTLENVLGVQPQNGWSPPASNHASSGTPVLTLSSVTGFKFRPDKIKFTSASVESNKKYWVKNGDFLITRSNTPELVGHVAIASGIETPTIYPDLIMRMNPLPERMTAEFLYYQMRTPRLRQEIMGRAQGANPTMKKISNGAVKTLPITVPSVAIQHVIVSTLNKLTEETQQLESLYQRKLEALDELKKSLLHQAFSGNL